VCVCERQRMIEPAVFLQLVVFLPLVIHVKRGLECFHGSSGPDYFTGA